MLIIVGAFVWEWVYNSKIKLVSEKEMFPQIY